jgi:serine O-acetyltransferase
MGMTVHEAPAAVRAWTQLRSDAERIGREEPLLAPMLRRCVEERTSFDDALAFVLAAKLANADASEGDLYELASEMMRKLPAIAASAATDLTANIERDPAYRDWLTPFAYAKGYHALEWHRIAHALWNEGRRDLATFLEGRVNDVLGVDIHPAARIGSGVFIDHATGVVIGETAVVGDDVSMLHGVTLGGTGKERGDRHPKIGRGVLLGTGSTVLGNVAIGEGAKVAAGSVVVRPVEAWTTVAGIPAVVVARSESRTLPGRSMDQDFVLDFQI